MIPLIVLIATAAAVQDPATLDAYLLAHPWNSAKRGPMLVVDPAETKAVDDSAGLSAFARQEVRCGGLNAIVPTEMVLIETSFSDPPDLYKGLPRQEKVLYLMSLLSNDEWKQACGGGIGLTDLTGEKQAIFRSILPATFSFSTRSGEENSAATLTPEEEASVKIHFYKDLELGVPFETGGQVLMGNRSRADDGRLYLQDASGDDRSLLYGIPVRKVAPNRPKPSNLNLKMGALNQPIRFPQSATVQQFCSAAGATAGLSILADTRIAGLPVQTAGTQAKASEVLQALALGICGTYRKVGRHFVLTSDLEGLGAKRLKIAFYQRDLDFRAGQVEANWASEIATRNVLSDLSYRNAGRLAPNQAMAGFIASESSNRITRYMPATELSGEWQQILAEDMKRSPLAQRLRPGEVEPNEELQWGFVLPDGRPLEPTGPPKMLRGFGRPQSGPRLTKADTDAGKINIALPSGSVLVARTDSAAKAAEIPGLAKTHGFSEVWLDSTEQGAIGSAIEAGNTAGIKIRLVLRPWAPLGKESLDRTITGQTATEAERLLVSSAFLANEPMALATGRITSQPTVPPSSVNFGNELSLSQIPGLAGVVLLDTEPRGYEPKPQVVGNGEIALGEIVDVGYSEPLREAFLEQSSVDPIDIVDARLRVGLLNLDVPFFGTSPRNGTGTVENSLPPGALQDWMKFRATANERSLQSLVSMLGRNVLFEPRALEGEGYYPRYHFIVPWQSPQPLPTMSTAPSSRLLRPSSDSNGQYLLWLAQWPLDPSVLHRKLMIMSHEIGARYPIPAIDASQVPADQLGKFLNSCFPAD